MGQTGVGNAGGKHLPQKSKNTKKLAGTAERSECIMPGFRTKLSPKLAAQFPDCAEGYFSNKKGFILLYCRKCGKPRYDQSTKPILSGCTVTGFNYTDTIWVRRDHSKDQCNCE